MKMIRIAAFAIAAASMAVAFAAPAPAQSAGTPISVRLSVGGQTALFYLPLTITAQLGYFKDAGLDVTITDLQGGSRALQALMGGSADVVAGAFDHTVQMHAKGQPILAIVQLGQFPGFALGIVTAKAAAYKEPKDLKGMKIGVTAPGSSTHFMVAYM
ncbi:MAG: ABC transporter substrate-binding protein, partial [Proteobacteria bacterium]|nr:ABC transporter substrate-binding protein [Pseudomonadota bacterium]